MLSVAPLAKKSSSIKSLLSKKRKAFSFDVASALNALSKVESASIVDLDVPEAMSPNRPRIRVRITEVYGRDDWNRIQGVVVGATVCYDTSQAIVNGRGKEVGYVDTVKKTMHLKIMELDHYKESRDYWLKTCPGEFPADPYEGQTEIVFKDGDQVNLKIDDPTNLQAYSIVDVSLSATRYCSDKSEKQPERLTHGVTMSAKQTEVVSVTNIKKFLTDCFENPESFKLPLPPLETLAEQDNYKHARNPLDKNVKKRKSSGQLMLPIIHSNEDIIHTFGEGSGIKVSWSFRPQNSVDAFKLKKKNGTVVRVARGMLRLLEWNRIEDLLAFSGAHPTKTMKDVHSQMKHSLFDFMMWDSDLDIGKITDVDLWVAMAEPIFRSFPMVLPVKVKYWDTYERRAAIGDQKSFENFFSVDVKQPIVDFVGSMIDRNLGVRVSKAWVERQCVKGLLDASKKRASTNQTNSPDKSYFLLNEWETKSREEWLQSPESDPKRWHFYALISRKMSAPDDPLPKRFRVINEYARESDDGNTVLGEALLWPKWDTNPQKFLDETWSPGEAPVDFDHTKHPLMSADYRTSAQVGVMDTILIYAVDTYTENKNLDEVIASYTPQIEAAKAETTETATTTETNGTVESPSPKRRKTDDEILDDLSDEDVLAALDDREQ